MRTPVFTRSLVRTVAPLLVIVAAITVGALPSMAQATQTPRTQPPTVNPKPQGTAQPTPPKMVVPEHGSGVRALNDQEIKLSPGDVIQIQVENHTALDGAFPIPGPGKLLLPEAGEITVAGFTVTEVRDHLQAELEKTLNNVFVRVLLREVHSRHVSINGVVLKQGDFDMGTREYRFLDIVDLAGGLNPPLYRIDAKLSEFSGKLYRGKVALPLDIDGAYGKPDGEANFVVQPNDRIQIEMKPLVTHSVHILGTILRQGTYPLDNNTTVLGLFGLCGFPSTSASLSTAYVIRDTTKIPMDLRPLLTGKVDTEVNKFKFQDGDELFIPPVLDKFMVWGSVGHQGNFPYPEGPVKVYLLDAITGAGETPLGEYRHVHLIRTENGKQTDKTINVDRMMRKGLMADNVLIKPDDIVWVPPKHLRQPASFMDGFNDVFQPLLMLSYFGIHPY